jgi:fatty-acyl-CoA synthase
MWSMLYGMTTDVNVTVGKPPTVHSSMTIVDAILDTAGGPGTLTILGAGPGTGSDVSWAGLHRLARSIGAALADYGVGPGSRVGLLGEPTVALVAALQAVWLAGAAVTVLPAPGRRAATQRLRPIVTDADLHLVVADPDLAAARPELPVRLVALPELVRRAGSAAPLTVRPPGPADLAVLQYTSGSTRSPRGVPVTHGHLAANLAALREVFGHDRRHPPQQLLSWLPLYHDLGLVGFLALAMSCRCPLVLQSPTRFALRPASWLEDLSRYRAAATGAPDSAYRLVTPLLEAGLAIDLRSVRFMLSGGEPISTGAMARFTSAAARYGLDPGAVVPAYGLAESTLAVTCGQPGAGLTTDSVDPEPLERNGRAVPPRPGGRARTLARLGRPVRGTQLRVVDPRTGAPAGPQEVGEVQVRGASVVGHYWGEPPAPVGEWLRTGDLGYLDDGELVLCGRLKDVVFAGGRNLYPHDIELAAAEVPGVRTGGAVAFGVPGQDGDRLVVMVESRGADRSALCRAVALAVAAETGMRPAQVLALAPGRLPRTTSGKLRRAEARRRYECGEFAGAPAPARTT